MNESFDADNSCSDDSSQTDSQGTLSSKKTNPTIAFSTLKEKLEIAINKSLELKQRDIVLFVGITGAGKSTSIASLLGQDLDYTEDGMPELQPTSIDPNRYPIIAKNSLNSETMYASVFHNEKKDIFYCDTPGFYGTHGTLARIIDFASLKMAVEACNEVKSVIVVLSMVDITGFKGEALKQTSRILGQMFKQKTTGEDITDTPYTVSLNFLITRLHPSDIKVKGSTALKEKIILKAKEWVRNIEEKEEALYEDRKRALVSFERYNKRWEGGQFKNIKEKEQSYKKLLSAKDQLEKAQEEINHFLTENKPIETLLNVMIYENRVVLMDYKCGDTFQEKIHTLIDTSDPVDKEAFDFSYSESQLQLEDIVYKKIKNFCDHFLTMESYLKEEKNPILSREAKNELEEQIKVQEKKLAEVTSDNQVLLKKVEISEYIPVGKTERKESTFSESKSQTYRYTHNLSLPCSDIFFVEPGKLQHFIDPVKYKLKYKFARFLNGKNYKDFGTEEPANNEFLEESFYKSIFSREDLFSVKREVLDNKDFELKTIEWVGRTNDLNKLGTGLTVAVATPFFLAFSPIYALAGVGYGIYKLVEKIRSSNMTKEEKELAIIKAQEEHKKENLKIKMDETESQMRELGCTGELYILTRVKYQRENIYEAELISKTIKGLNARINGENNLEKMKQAYQVSKEYLLSNIEDLLFIVDFLKVLNIQNELAHTFQQYYKSLGNEIGLSPICFKGLSLKKVRDDGNCLFHAVRLHLDKDPNTLRRMVADYLETHESDFIQFRIGDKKDFQAYVASVRNGTVWGGAEEIEALQRITGRPFIILRPDSNPTMPDNIETYTGEPLFVYFDGKNHYDAIEVQKNSDAREILNNILSAMNEGLPVVYQEMEFTNNQKLHFSKEVKINFSPTFFKSQKENLANAFEGCVDFVSKERNEVSEQRKEEIIKNLDTLQSFISFCHQIISPNFLKEGQNPNHELERLRKENASLLMNVNSLKEELDKWVEMAKNTISPFSEKNDQITLKF